PKFSYSYSCETGRIKDKGCAAPIIFTKQGSWKRNERHAQQQQEVSPKKPCIVSLDITENSMVLNPHQARNHEANDKPYELRQETNQCVTEISFTQLFKVRRFYFKHEQCDDNRKDSIAEENDTLKAQTRFLLAHVLLHCEATLSIVIRSPILKEKFGRP